MPGHGENSVEVFMKRSDLIVIIAYDNEDGGEQRREIKFTNVSAFYRSSFPGPGVLKITYSIEDKENISISKLVEYPESEAAQAWTEYWNKSCGLTEKIKHYMWIFTSENIRLEVFAEGVQWEDHPS
jgi:hypothetical protein